MCCERRESKSKKGREIMLYKMLSLILLHPNLAFLRSSQPAVYFREETEDLISRDSFIQSHAASAWESWGLNTILLTTS